MKTVRADGGKDALKEKLREAFAAPAPVDKERFLRTVPQPQMSHVEFMLLQIGYMKKWIWAVSAFVFGIALNGACFWNRDMLWVIASLMPFIALSLTTENARSAVYGMEELEMASRFSLRSVVLARLGILGFFHTLLLCVLVPLSSRNSVYTVFQTGIYLIVPYLITTVLSLGASRQYHGKEVFYMCMGIAALVSVLHTVISGGAKILYTRDYFKWWVAAFAILSAGFIMECRKMIRQTEEIG